jgi:hypothetical protein
VFVALVLLFLAFQVIANLWDGPDKTVVGTVSTLETRLLCVTAADSPPVCVQFDAPVDVEGLALGDCVKVVYSAEGILMRTSPAVGC